MPWTFDSVSFSPNSDTGWVYDEALDISLPLNATEDIITSFGFHSGQRTVEGRTNNLTTVQSLRTKFLAKTTGNLVDDKSATARARIIRLSWRRRPKDILEYEIDFIKRP